MKTELDNNLSVKYHIRMIVAILLNRFILFVDRHRSFLYGLVIGGLIGSVVMFFILADIPSFPVYNEPDVVVLPAQTDAEITDTELIGNHTTGFNFTGRIIATNAPVNQFECSLDNEGFGSCEPPVKIVDAEKGDHTFEVRSKLANGTVDPTPAVWLWNVK